MSKNERQDEKQLNMGTGDFFEIRVYPDPILKNPTELVDRFDEDLAYLVDKMKVTMEINEGAGLAAPQVGISRKLAIVSASGAFYVLINPRIVLQEGEQEGEEGCLSFPGIYANVKRPFRVVVEAQDLEGNLLTHDVEGFLARAFLHEMDHLEGKLFIEYLSALKRGMIRKKMHKRAAAEEA